jgi:predicted dienelactone hydrolase
MIRKLSFAVAVTGLVIVGVLMQTGSYLLALPSPPEAKAEPNAAIATPYAEPGPHDVGVRRLTVDEAPMPLTVWYPALNEEAEKGSLTYSYALNLLGADSPLALATYQGHADPGATPNLAEGPYPLVVLSPGFAIRSSSYAWLAEHLASHGLVVVSPQHNESLDPGGLWRSAIDRPQDILTLLAYLDQEVQPDGGFTGLIDTETVAVIGHSYGGYTALAAAGARWDTQALQVACDTARNTDDPLVFLCDALQPRLDDMADLAGLDPKPSELWPGWADPRVDAAISMAGDAAMFGQAGLAQITVPVMAIGGTADTDSPFQWTTQPTYEHAAAPRKAQVALQDAKHFIFAGPCQQPRRLLDIVTTSFCSDPGWDRYQAHDLIRHYATAFLLAELTQDLDAAAALSQTDTTFTGITYRQQGYPNRAENT